MSNTLHSKPTILIVDPSKELRLVLSELLVHEGYETTTVGSIPEASSVLGRGSYEVAYVDGDAFQPSELTALAKKTAPKTPPIVVAGTNRPIFSGNLGILFIRKPYHYRELVHKIDGAWNAVDAQVRAAA